MEVNKFDDIPIDNLDSRAIVLVVLLLDPRHPLYPAYVSVLGDAAGFNVHLFVELVRKEADGVAHNAFRHIFAFIKILEESCHCVIEMSSDGPIGIDELAYYSIFVVELADEVVPSESTCFVLTESTR